MFHVTWKTLDKNQFTNFLNSLPQWKNVYKHGSVSNNRANFIIGKCIIDCHRYLYIWYVYKHQRRVSQLRPPPIKTKSTVVSIRAFFFVVFFFFILLDFFWPAQLVTSNMFRIHLRSMLGVSMCQRLESLFFLRFLYSFCCFASIRLKME